MIKTKKCLEGLSRAGTPERDRHKKLRLDMNENIGDFPANVIREILSEVDSEFLSSYPEYESCYEKLSARHALPANHFLLTNGSDSVSELAFQTFVESGDTVLLTNPTFAMHKIYAHVAGAKMDEIAYTDYTFPCDALLERISKDTRMVILVNPVNPFGTTVTERDLVRILEKTAECGAMCFVDEAYAEFTTSSAIPHVRNFENLFVSRTFSKAGGIAALRLGYAVAQPVVCQALRLPQPTYDVNKIALRFGEYMLDHPEVVEDFVHQVNEGRAYVKDELKKLGLDFQAGEANFMLIQLGARRDQVVAALKKREILVSSGFRIPFIENCIRITIGPKSKMERFISALKDVLKGA